MGRLAGLCGSPTTGMRRREPATVAESYSTEMAQGSTEPQSALKLIKWTAGAFGREELVAVRTVHSVNAALSSRVTAASCSPMRMTSLPLIGSALGTRLSIKAIRESGCRIGESIWLTS